MTGRALAIQGGLALAGLIVAYTTWQREPERAAGEVVVVDSTKAELGNVHYEDENTVVDVRRKDDGGEKSVWLRIEDKTPVAPAAKPGQPPPPATPKPHPPRELRGEEPAEKFLAQFAPFRSPRVFGVLDATKIKELGLGDSKKRLTVTARGETREFVIGQPAALGGETYLRDTKDGRVYLMARTLASDLQSASHRLVDRRLHTFKIPDFSRVTVKANGKTRELVVTNGRDQAAYKLASSTTPDKPDEMARNWHEKIWRLFPTEILGKGELPPGGEPKVAVRVEYADRGKTIGWIEIGKVDAPEQAPLSSNPAKPADLYGRTEHTAGWVKLSNDQSTLQEAEKIAAGT